MPLDRLLRLPTKTTLSAGFTLGLCVFFTTLTTLFIYLSWSARSGGTVQRCDESLKKVGSSGTWCLRVRMMIKKLPAAGLKDPG